MQFKSILASKKNSIIRQWFEQVTASYPADTAAFLKRQQDPFANPVGSTTLKGLEALFDEIASGMDRETINAFLDPIIRIRAVQDFTPSRAVGFVLQLKPIISETLRPDSDSPDPTTQIAALNHNIDQVCLMAFDIFMRCREQLHNLRVHETRNTMFGALERAGLVVSNER